MPGEMSLPRLRAWLEAGQVQPVLEMAGRRKRVLSFLTALSYDPEPLVAWRAVEALGLAAGLIAERDPEYVRSHLRRLAWLLSDESGGIGWRAPEAMGEIIRSQPDLFPEFIPILISLLDMEAEDAVRFRAGILWAIGRLAQVAPEMVQPALPEILPCLSDPDPQTRGIAAWCLCQLAWQGGGGQATASDTLKVLLADPGPVALYDGGQLAQTCVASLASQALRADLGSFPVNVKEP